MAGLADILQRKWAGAAWSLSGDDYATLDWQSDTAKPGEAEIRAFSAEVDEIMRREEMVVSPRQFRLALLGAGLYEAFKAMVAAADEATQITVEYAVRFERLSPLVDVFAAQAGMTAEQVDGIFEAAAAIGD